MFFTVTPETRRDSNLHVPIVETFGRDNNSAEEVQKLASSATEVGDTFTLFKVHYFDKIEISAAWSKLKYMFLKYRILR